MLGISRRQFLSTGAAAGLIMARAPSVSAQSYGLDASGLGVLADSATDQTTAIQSAIDRTRINGTPLFLPPGRYHARTLQLGSGARLVGVPGATRLVSLGGGPLIRSEGAERLGLDGIVCDGLMQDLLGAGALVELQSVAAADIVDCEILNSWSDGLRLNGCGGRITGSRFSGARGAALFSLDGSNLEISNNHVADCGDNGILVWQSTKRTDGARILGNHIERIRNVSGGDGPYGNGIAVFRGGGITIANNRITDCNFSAIRVNSGSNVIVAQNNCARMVEVALYVEFAFDGAVVASNIVDGANHGISVTNLDHDGHLAVVSGNVIRNIEFGPFAEPRGDGIFVAAESSLVGNVVENVAGAGYSLGYGPYLRNVTATGNVVRQAAVGFKISVVEGIKNVLVADNVISEVSKAAILGMEWEQAVTGDLAREGAAAFPELTLSDNRVG